MEAYDQEYNDKGNAHFGGHLYLGIVENIPGKVTEKERRQERKETGR